MKRFIAIALIGAFSLLMVGTVYASFESKASVELVKGLHDVSLVGIMDGVTPSVTPQYSKMVTVLPTNETLLAYTADINQNANDPPTIRLL